MTGLEGINREEWSSVPFLLRLVGGPGDGREITWGSLPPIFRLPVETPLAELLMDVGRVSVMSLRCIEYVQTDHVADDGARLYQMRKS